MDQFLLLIGAIYETVGETESWPGLLGSLTKSFGGTSAALTLRSGPTQDGAMSLTHNIDPAAKRVFTQHFATVDPFLEPSRLVPLDRAMTGEELIEPSALRRTPFYNEFLLPYGLDHFTGVAIVRPTARHMSYFNVFRPARFGPFGSDAAARLAVIGPHLRRALSMQRMVDEASATKRSAVDALDALDLGVLLLDATGHVMIANRRAEQALQQAHPLRARGGRLSCARPADTAALDALIGKAKSGALDTPGALVVLDRDPNQTAFEITVSPIGTRLCDSLAEPGARLMVVARELGGGRALSAEAFMSLFGLSRAESRVAVAAAAGATARDIAARLGVGRETVRTQLKAVYAKIGVRRQADLVRLVGPREPALAAERDAIGVLDQT